MLRRIFKLFSGSHYRKFIKNCQPIVAKINQLEEEYQKLSDEQLKAKTVEFKARLAQGETLDQLLPEAFATVKNAARRLCGQSVTVCDHELAWDMVHYDVQMIGGMALHRNKIAEMATGEGKTLVATLPLYLNALTGKNCQLVTVNDYLARRDSEWNGYLYRFLGLTVGCIQNNMNSEQRKAMYECDITYGTASEFGFDYLRDNGMTLSKESQVQRDHYFCIVDEIDSILVDEARTPLIISGPMEQVEEAPFRAFKSEVQSLVALQQKLCNQLMSEAKELIEKGGEDADKAVEKLYQVKLGMPKNRLFMRLMENPAYRKRFDKFDLEMNSDFNRDQRYSLKEALYFSIDEKQQQADLTEKGRNALRPDSPDAFVLPDLPTLFSDFDKQTDLSEKKRLELKQEAEAHFAKASEEIHCLSQLLRAYCLYEKDIQYVVQEGKVVIIDENTGRAMPGRRWSEGLHQAIEAKENVSIEKETKTYATITIQNYFRMYDKLSGMTGTAETEAGEFYDIYKLNVMVVPTHRPCIRKDDNDVIYKTRREKYNAVILDIIEAHKQGQPVLVGTTSVESSEVLSKMLKRQNIAHNVLNAKYHQQEADIVARAGQKGAVTIATNMAGRGTDIKLGEGVAAVGGLLVLGTARHESRRIDRQLRGRCSRQGDPGRSKFFISLEDDLMRLFLNAGPIGRILEKNFKEGEQLEHPMLNRSIESAQKKVEQQNYSIRKRLLQYDDVLNKQREVIYGLRNDALHAERPKELIFELIEEELNERIDAEGKRSLDKESLEGFLNWVNMHFPVFLKLEAFADKSSQEITTHVVKCIHSSYAAKESVELEQDLIWLERLTIVKAIDRRWQDHLTEMEELRRSVSLRGYGQKDPLNEYKSEAFAYFEEMMGHIRRDICLGLFRSATNAKHFQTMMTRITSRVNETGPANLPTNETERRQAIPQITIKREDPKIGRNDPCPCGSGRKYKKCCGEHVASVQ